ncbi:hypothetical protein G6F32_015136 [Rhizopus arrhizus]|nr:hypothetical protein G6F32_015136 [Rhizopus arrhizus]
MTGTARARRRNQPVKARQQNGHRRGARPENHPLAPHPVRQHPDEGRGQKADGAHHDAGRQRGRRRQAQFPVGVGRHIEADDLRADHAANHQQYSLQHNHLVLGEHAAQRLMARSGTAGLGSNNAGRYRRQRLFQVAADGSTPRSEASPPARPA